MIRDAMRGSAMLGQNEREKRKVEGHVTLRVVGVRISLGASKGLQTHAFVVAGPGEPMRGRKPHEAPPIGNAGVHG